jgi:uncharacterized FlgJ-related protein
MIHALTILIAGIVIISISVFTSRQRKKAVLFQSPSYRTFTDKSVKITSEKLESLTQRSRERLSSFCSKTIDALFFSRARNTRLSAHQVQFYQPTDSTYYVL